MADVRPFRGLRYNPDLVTDLSQVICPPYDVISPQQQEALYQRSPYNIVRLEYGKAGPGSDRYTAAAHIFQEWRRQEVLVADRQPAFYLLQETYADRQGAPRTRHALVGGVRLEEFSKGGILPHEETGEGAKRDRLELLSACRANLSPIMGLYWDSSGGVLSVIEAARADPPLYQVSGDGGEAVTVWRLSQPQDVAAIQEALRPLPLYLADGHHRYETSLTYRDLQRSQGERAEDSEYVMMALIDLADSGLQLLGYHRLLGGLGPEEERLLAHHAESTFEEVRSVELPAEEGEAAQRVQAILGEGHSGRQVVGLVDRQGIRFRLLALREEAAAWLARQNPSTTELTKCDVWALQEGVLDPVMHSHATHGAALRLEYTPDEGEALRQVREGSFQVAFLLQPMPLGVFEGVVRQGVRLPPKSTYFTPKLPTGLVIYAFGV